MAKVRTWVGLDVHAQQAVACVVDAVSGEVSVRRLGGGVGELAGFCARLARPVSVAYEAGPTGFALARALAAAGGVGCLVAAPGKLERATADRVKTDRRDAERLVRLLMIDALQPVRVPSVEEEAVRDLVRAREDLRGDLMRARHRLGKLLLRHELRYQDGSAWTAPHRAWLGRLELAEPAAQASLLDYLGAIDALLVRRETLERRLAELVPSSPWACEIARLRCLRGIDTLSAVGLCAEIGDFARFERPDQLSSYLGLVPSEHSSGQSRKQGAITKTGSRHARRLLVEAAWHYRRPPRLGASLRRRQHGQTPATIATAWKAQQRLHQHWRRLETTRGKRKTIVAVAVARHLAGFCWAISQNDS